MSRPWYLRPWNEQAAEYLRQVEADDGGMSGPEYNPHAWLRAALAERSEMSDRLPWVRKIEAEVDQLRAEVERLGNNLLAAEACRIQDNRYLLAENATLRALVGELVELSLTADWPTWGETEADLLSRARAALEAP